MIQCFKTLYRHKYRINNITSLKNIETISFINYRIVICYPYYFGWFNIELFQYCSPANLIQFVKMRSYILPFYCYHVYLRYITRINYHYFSNINNIVQSYITSATLHIIYIQLIILKRNSIISIFTYQGFCVYEALAHREMIMCILSSSLSVYNESFHCCYD